MDGRSVLYVRLPEPLKALLREQARENGRTVNAEVVHLLRQALTGYRV
jgi:plasmid stability protein